MGLELRLSQKIEQKTLIQQRLEVRQQLAEQMSVGISSLRDAAGGNDEELLGEVIGKLLENIQNDRVRASLKELLTDDGLRRQFLENVELLAVPSEQRIENFVLNYFYESFDGYFSFESQDEKEKSKIKNTYKIDKGHFDLAYKNPEKLEYEIAKMEETTALYGGKGDPTIDVQGMVREAGQMREAKIVMSAARENIDLLKGAIRVSLLKNGANGEQSILGSFIRDTAILRRLDFVLSERIQKRFVARFSKIRNGNPADYEDAFLNTIGEYSLASLGIVDPELFRLQKAEIDPFLYRDTKAVLGEMGLDYDKLAQNYNLKGSGTIFWNRWAIKGQKPSRITDDKIREFLTKTVRKDGESLLKAADFKNFFEETKAMLKRTSSEDRENELRKLLTEKFEESGFRGILLDLIKNKWYTALDVFINSQNKK